MLMTSGEDAVNWSLNDLLDMEELELVGWFNDYLGIQEERADSYKAQVEEARRRAKNQRR